MEEKEKKPMRTTQILVGAFFFLLVVVALMWDPLNLKGTELVEEQTQLVVKMNGTSNGEEIPFYNLSMWIMIVGVAVMIISFAISIIFRTGGSTLI